jgi:capsular polysaccharide export protein
MKVYVLISYYSSAPFFYRLAKADRGNDYVFVCVSPAAYFYLKKEGLNCVFFKIFGKRGEARYNRSDLMNAVEFRAGYSSEKKCIKYCDRLYAFLIGFMSKEVSDVYLLTWNGDNLNGIVIRDIAKTNSRVKTGFFEVSNLPGKLFVDGKGVNKRSNLYENTEFLDSLSLRCGEKFLRDYRKRYLEFKNEYKVNKISFFPKYWKFVDFLFFYLLGVRFFKIPKLKKNSRSEINFTSIQPKDYVLYPLQVRTDTQVVLNSSVDLCEGLLKVLDDTELPVVITPHPYDLEAVNDLSSIIKNSSSIYVSNLKTFDLISDAKKVYVLNSTIGLEAKIIGKPVVFLGDSFFDKITDDQVDKYIHSFLFDGDFVGEEELSEDAVARIFNVIEKSNYQ